MKSFRLFSPDPAESNGNPPAPQPESPPAPPVLPAPPAARMVIEGEETEETVRLRADLEKERNARKKVETEAATFQDELHRLKNPEPKKVVDDERSTLEKWFAGEDV